MSTIVYDYCTIGKEVEIGEHTVIGSHSVILGKVVIGSNVRIQSFAFIPSGTTIEDEVFIGPRVTILNDKYPPSKGKHWLPVVICKGAIIGGNVTILPGVYIGKEAFIGAGSVVTKNVKSKTRVYGNPAREK